MAKTKKEVEIKAIIFDVGGVLRINRFLNLNKKHSGAHEYIAEKLGVSVDTWFDSIDTAYANSIIGKISKKEFIKITSKNLNINPNKLVNLVAKAYKKKVKKNKKLFRLAFKLKKRGYQIGILSDQWALSEDALMPKEDTQNFDIVISSIKVGLRKPNPKIYKLLIKKTKLKPEQILFTDNREWNTKPAEKLGIKTITFKNNKQFMKDIKKFIR